MLSPTLASPSRRNKTKPSFETMVFLSSGNIVTFAVALCGFIWLVWRHPKHNSFLAVLMVLSAFAFFGLLKVLCDFLRSRGGAGYWVFCQ